MFVILWPTHFIFNFVFCFSCVYFLSYPCPVWKPYGFFLLLPLPLQTLLSCSALLRRGEPALCLQCLRRPLLLLLLSPAKHFIITHCAVCQASWASLSPFSGRIARVRGGWLAPGCRRRGQTARPATGSPPRRQQTHLLRRINTIKIIHSAGGWITGWICCCCIMDNPDVTEPRIIQ